MQTLDSQTKSSPLWVRVLPRLVSAIVAAGILGFIGKLSSGHDMMINGICLGVFLGLVWGEKVFRGIFEMFLIGGSGNTH